MLHSVHKPQSAYAITCRWTFGWSHIGTVLNKAALSELGQVLWTYSFISSNSDFFFFILREKPSCEVITVQFIFTVDVRELEVVVGGGKGP